MRFIKYPLFLFLGFCPTGWMLLADKCYEFIVNPNRGETWTSANEKCQLNGAGLLKIES